MCQWASQSGCCWCWTRCQTMTLQKVQAKSTENDRSPACSLPPSLSLVAPSQNHSATDAIQSAKQLLATHVVSSNIFLLLLKGSSGGAGSYRPHAICTPCPLWNRRFTAAAACNATHSLDRDNDMRAWEIPVPITLVSKMSPFLLTYTLY
jgi:hypothetical protein